MNKRTLIDYTRVVDALARFRTLVNSARISDNLEPAFEEAVTLLREAVAYQGVVWEELKKQREEIVGGE